MNQTLKEILVLGVVIAVSVAVGLGAYAWVFHALQPKSQAGIGAAGNLLAEQYDPYIQQNGGYNSALPVNTSGLLSTTGTFQLGAAGSVQANQVNTTCSMIANSPSVGTTTQYAYCAGVAGVTSADNVDANFATSSTALTDQWVITGAKASTTPGAIDFRLLNLTGTAASKSMSSVTTIGSTTIIQAGH